MTNYKGLSIGLLILMIFTSSLTAQTPPIKEEFKTEKSDRLNKELFDAVKAKDLEAVKKLVNEGANVNAKNSSDESLLESLFKVLNNDGPSMEPLVNFLIEQGHDIHHIGGFNMTYLHEAVSRNMLTTAELLIDKGIDYTLVTSIGDDPAFFYADTQEMIELFIKKKAGNFKDVNKDGDTLLHNAASLKPNLKLIKFLIKHIPIDTKNNVGNTALISILDYDYFPKEIDAIVEFLLANGADVNTVGARERTPLLVALRNRKILTQTIERLIKAGADLNYKDKYGIQAIHFAAASNFNYLKLLVKHGVDLNALSGETHETPLLVGTKYNRKSTVKYLLEHGVDLNVKDENGKTALNYALSNDYSDIVMYLQQKGALATDEDEISKIEEELKKSKDEKEKNSKKVEIKSFNDAVKANNLAEVKKYYEIREADKSKKPINLFNIGKYVLRKGDIKTFEYLVSKGLDIHSKNKKGYTLLHYSVLYDNLEVTKFLIGNELDINALSDENRSVFTLSSNSSPEIIKYLIKSNIKLEDTKTSEIVDEAIWYKEPEVAKYYMTLGYKIQTKDHENNDFLVKLINDSEIETLGFLLKNGLDINTKVYYRGYTATLLHLAIMLNKTELSISLINAGADLNARSKRGEAIFESVINKVDMDIMKAFYDKGALLNDTSGVWKRTPLHVALDLQRVDKARYLINKGADLTIVEGFHKNTPIHVAAEKGYLGLIKQMVSKGANPHALNSKDRSALDIAKEYKQEAVQKYLSSLKK